MIPEKKHLKPVVFIQGKYAYNRQNTTQQIMLLKALRITQDPKKLKELIGVKTVAEVYRTLDKIAIRKEYHKALAKQGISFDYIVTNIKKEIDDDSNKTSDKLSGLNMILKSIGMDKYDETAIGSGGWEEAIAAIQEKGEKTGEEMEIPKYEVIEPEVPEEVRAAQAKNIEETKGLYD